MKKSFNRVQTLKSSEDCNCAKVVEKWLQIPPIFRLVKIVSLVAVLSINMVSESQAASDCAEGEQNCWDCGKTAADLCTARLDTTTKSLSVTGSGEMRDYPGMWYDHTKTPWGVDYTSLSVQGVKNIGLRAFENTKLTSVSIGDTVTKIGVAAFDNNRFLPSITIPDSVTSIDRGAFFNNSSLAKVFIPESVTEVVTFIHSDVDNNEKGPFDRNSGGSTLYCAETTPCYSYVDSNVITYTKDSNGVYKIGNNYFASPDDMLANSACGSGSSASDECITAALAYQDQKAENMAGGALCATKQDCLKLIDRANKKDVCNSIADCANNYDKNCFNKGKVVYNDECMAEYPFAKKRWTPAEANEWLHDGNDNFVIITFKK